MRAKLIRGGLIAIAAMVLFWLSGFLLLTRGSDWPDIEAAIVGDVAVRAIGGGAVRGVKPEFLGYGYGFSGEGGYAVFTAKTDGVSGSKRVKLYLKMEKGRWSIDRTKELSD